MIVTLGVHDFGRALRFYSEWFGREPDQVLDEWACFVRGEGALMLFPWDSLAEDAGLPAEASRFRGVTLAYNVASRERVDEVYAAGERAGASVVKRPVETFWGGYSGYVADPDGHLWEVATGAEQLPLSE